MRSRERSDHLEKVQQGDGVEASSRSPNYGSLWETARIQQRNSHLGSLFCVVTEVTAIGGKGVLFSIGTWKAGSLFGGKQR
jgi:hypothetical protein